MRKLIGAVLALTLLCSGVTLASDKSVYHSGEIPPSTGLNQQPRNDRTTIGIVTRDLLGPALTTNGGSYSNLSVLPNGGMFVSVQPTSLGEGAVYQLRAEDPLPLPQNEVVQLAADLNPVAVVGLQNGPIGGIGPMIAPVSGSSVYYLVEAKVVDTDGPAVPVAFENITGGKNYANLSVTRSDVVTYQVVSGVASSLPTVPAPDSGWVGIATVLIPAGTSAVTSAMISPLAPLSGVVFQGGTSSLGSLSLPNAGVGCLQTITGGSVVSLPCTSGLGTVNGVYPLTSSASGSVVTINCPTCVTGVTSGTVGQLAVSAGTAPVVSLVHGNYVDIANAQTITGAKTFSGGIQSPTIGTANLTATNSSLGPTSISGLVTSSKSVTIGIPGQNAGLTSLLLANSYNDGTLKDYSTRIGQSGDTIANVSTDILNIGYTDATNGFTDALGLDHTGDLGLAGTGNSAVGFIVTNPTLSAYKFHDSLNQPVSLGEGCSNSQVTATEFGVSDYSGKCLLALNDNGALGSAGVAYFAGGFQSANLSSSLIYNLSVSGPLVELAYNAQAIGFPTNTPKVATYFGASTSATINTVNGATFELSAVNTQNGTTVINPYMTMDASGNVGLIGSMHITGSYLTGSKRSLKNHIEPLSGEESLRDIMQTDWVKYAYRSEHLKTWDHLGFIADDSKTPFAFAGSSRDHFDVGAVASADASAIKFLQGEIQILFGMLYFLILLVAVSIGLYICVCLELARLKRGRNASSL